MGRGGGGRERLLAPGGENGSPTVLQGQAWGSVHPPAAPLGISTAKPQRFQPISPCFGAGAQRVLPQRCLTCSGGRTQLGYKGTRVPQVPGPGATRCRVPRPGQPRVGVRPGTTQPPGPGCTQGRHGETSRAPLRGDRAAAPHRAPDPERPSPRPPTPPAPGHCAGHGLPPRSPWSPQPRGEPGSTPASPPRLRRGPPPNL